jgi:hypothetical protein
LGRICSFDITNNINALIIMGIILGQKEYFKGIGQIKF